MKKMNAAASVTMFLSMMILALVPENPPANDFNVTLRLYWPKQAVLDGAWTPPPIKRVE
jgi:hypothetical protein